MLDFSPRARGPQDRRACGQELHEAPIIENMTHHFGVLIPSTNTTVEAELARLPAVVSGALRQAAHEHAGASVLAEPRRGHRLSVEAARHREGRDDDSDPDFGEPFADDYDETTTRRMSAAAGGVPAITSAYAMARALRALGAKRIALVSPYSEAVNALARRYFTGKHGLEIARLEGFAASDSYPSACSAPRTRVMPSPGSTRRTSTRSRCPVLISPPWTPSPLGSASSGSPS